MQLLNKGKANRKERDLFYSTRARPERKTGSRVVFAECLQKKRRRNPPSSLSWICVLQNRAPAFWHGSVTRADGGTESVGAEGAAFMWCEKRCCDAFNANFLTLCCRLK